MFGMLKTDYLQFFLRGSGYVDKQNVVCTRNGILFIHQKECSSDTNYNMNEP